MLLTTGCPVGITYPLGTPGTEKIDKSILGKWGQEPGDDKEILSVQIEKKDDHTLKVTVLERGPLYMEEVDDFNGWFTEINDMQFVYFQNAADANYWMEEPMQLFPLNRLGNKSNYLCSDRNF